MWNYLMIKIGSESAGITTLSIAADVYVNVFSHGIMRSAVSSYLCTTMRMVVGSHPVLVMVGD